MKPCGHGYVTSLCSLRAYVVIFLLCACGVSENAGAVVTVNPVTPEGLALNQSELRRRKARLEAKQCVPQVTAHE